MADIITREEIKKALEIRHTKEGQAKLTNSKVAIMGLGGLGSNIAIACARMGIGEMLLVDFDVVDITNIFRQNYRLEHIGRYKTECIKEEISEINPYLKINTINTRITRENVLEILGDYKIICEAFDKGETKSEIIDEILSKSEDKIIISGNGMAGIKSVNLIRTRQFVDRLYICGDLENGIEIEGTLMSPRVSACAMHQANVVANLILSDGKVDL